MTPTGSQHHPTPMKLALIAATLIAVLAIAASGYLWYQNGQANKRMDNA